MASAKRLLFVLYEVYSFTVCFGKYFTLVLANSDKRSTTVPVGVWAAQTNLHCAALCDMESSCYSFTFSKNSVDNCRLLPSAAITSTFTLTDMGSKHYTRKVDCNKCTVNYTMAMEDTFDCRLQQETSHASGWTKSDIHSAMVVLNGNDMDFVATTSGCSTSSEFQCLHFYWYATGPATLTVTAGSGTSPTTFFTQTASDGVTVDYERVILDIPASDSSLGNLETIFLGFAFITFFSYIRCILPRYFVCNKKDQVRFIGYKTKNTGGGSSPLGLFQIKMNNCPCSCIT